MSKTKKENNRPSKYQELNDFELEVVCGGGCGPATDCDGPVRDEPEEVETKI